jgi:hypothetical protein
MNRNDFLNMMSESVPLNRQLIGEVYELIDIFPYFQSAHLLLLKGLKSNADVKFENQLRNSAIHIADREILYYLLKRKPPVVEDHIDIIHEKPPVADTLSDTQQTVIESAKNSTDLINEIENSSTDTKQNERQDNINLPAGHPILIGSETDNEEPARVMILMDEEISPGEDKIFFMDPGFSVPEYEDLLELDLDDSTEETINETSEVFDLPDSKDNDSKKQMQSALIDKFIIANPRIEPIRDKSGPLLEEIHRPLVEEDGGFVTETLARIYISQEYYSKAIDIYEKLSLKFPEKSSYFASQIEKVKEYIKK